MAIDVRYGVLHGNQLRTAFHAAIQRLPREGWSPSAWFWPCPPQITSGLACLVFDKDGEVLGASEYDGDPGYCRAEPDGSIQLVAEVQGDRLAIAQKSLPFGFPRGDPRDEKRFLT